MQTRATLLLALLSTPLLLGAECVPKGDDTGGLSTDGDGAGDDGATGGGGGGDDTAMGETLISGTISGSVTVELYTTDENGARQYISYEDATGGAFPGSCTTVTDRGMEERTSVSVSATSAFRSMSSRGSGRDLPMRRRFVTTSMARVVASIVSCRASRSSSDSADASRERRFEDTTARQLLRSWPTPDASIA